MSWKEDIVKDFVELVSYDSLSFHERKTADWIIKRLRGLGFDVVEVMQAASTVGIQAIYLQD